MGANVELDIFLKKEGFSLQPIVSLLKKEGLYISIQEMRAFDDWEYTKEANIDIRYIDINTSSIFLEKFTLIHFNVNAKWRCTLTTSLIGEKYINLSFGLDTDDLLQKREENIDDHAILIYSRFADIIDDKSSKEKFKDRFIGSR